MANGELVVPASGNLVVRGFEGAIITKDDLEMPRAKLFHGTQEEQEKFGLPAADAGHVINTLTREQLPERFIPTFYWKTYVRFNPRKRNDPLFNPAFEPSAIIWRSADPDDPRVRDETPFGSNGEPPLAVTFLNFLTIFPDVQMPLVLSFSKTSFSAGRHLLSLAKWSQESLWHRAYRLTTKVKVFSNGSAYVFVVEPLGRSTNEERTQAEAWWRMFNGKADEIKVHEEEQPEVESQPF